MAHFYQFYIHLNCFSFYVQGKHVLMFDEFRIVIKYSL